MSTILSRLIPGVFPVALALVLINAFFFYATFQELLDNEEKVATTTRTITTIKNISSSLDHAEADQRGYILSGDTIYKNLFSSQYHHIATHLQTLQASTDFAKTHQKDIARLSELIKVRKSVLEEGIVIRDEAGVEAAANFVFADEKSDKADSIQQVIAVLEKKASMQLALYQQETESSKQIMYSTISFSTLVNLLLIAIAYYLISSELKRHNVIEQRKDEFINLASHELKTPITSQKVYTQLLRKETTKFNNEKVNSYIEKIDDQTAKLTELITNLLDVSRIQTGKLQVNKNLFDLNVLIADTVEAVQGTTRKHTLVFKGRKPITVFADRYRIYQVLVNLLTNAIKYSPHGGKITISMQKISRQVKVSVADKGIGIAKEHQKKIFQRLYQVSDVKSKSHIGLGIGLYISSQIIRRHSGTLTVKSTPGKGSVFSFTLPLHKE